MSASANSFSIPREQLLAWQHLNMGSSPSPQAGAGAPGHFFFWARNALFHALHALEVPSSARILVPAYLCKAAVEPFEAFGAGIDFYSIRRDCTLDLNEIEAKIRPDTRVLLAAHYFGFPQRIVELRSLCDKKSLLLLEDCAHVLRGDADGQPLGSFGDASVFSYRKFLPMFDGAELLFRNPKHQLRRSGNLERSRFASQAAKHIIGQALDWSSGGAAKLVLGGINLARKRRSAPQSSKAPDILIAVDNNSASFDPVLVNQPITFPSRWVLRHSNVSTIVVRRRQNFEFLHEQLQDVPGITPLGRTLVDGVCPWIYPLFFNEVPDAHLLLRAAGIPAVTWGGVRPRNVSPAEFPDADFLYHNLLFLPIHQNLSRGQLRSMADTVKRVRAEAHRSTRESVPVAS